MHTSSHYPAPSQPSPIAVWSWTVCRGFDRGNRALLRMLLQPQYCLSHLAMHGHWKGKGEADGPSACVSSQSAAWSKQFTSTPTAHSNAAPCCCQKAKTFPWGKWEGKDENPQRPNSPRSFIPTPVSSSPILCSFRHKLRPLEYVTYPTADEGWSKAVVEGKKE